MLESSNNAKNQNALACHILFADGDNLLKLRIIFLTLLNSTVLVRAMLYATLAVG